MFLYKTFVLHTENNRDEFAVLSFSNPFNFHHARFAPFVGVCEFFQFPEWRRGGVSAPSSLPPREFPVTLDLTFSLLRHIFGACFCQPAASLDLFMSKYDLLILSNVNMIQFQRQIFPFMIFCFLHQCQCIEIPFSTIKGTPFPKKKRFTFRHCSN